MKPVDTEAFEKWLDESPFIDEPDAQQLAAARAVMSSEGMRVIWGMMLAAAHEKRVTLENLPLGTPERDHMAGVIQGGIKGIYVLRSTLLELLTIGRSQQPANEETLNG